MITLPRAQAAENMPANPTTFADQSRQDEDSRILSQKIEYRTADSMTAALELFGYSSE